MSVTDAIAEGAIHSFPDFATLRRAITMGATISVVIPTLNEAANLPHVLFSACRRSSIEVVDRRRPLNRRHDRRGARPAPGHPRRAPGLAREGQRARVRVRGGHRRHHRDARRRRIHRSGGDSPLRLRRSSTETTSRRARASRGAGAAVDITLLRRAGQPLAGTCRQHALRQCGTPTPATATTPSGAIAWRICRCLHRLRGRNADQRPRGLAPA